MNLLITGSGGFLGKILLTDLKNSYNIESLSMRDEKWTRNNLSKYDVIIHLAGIAHNNDRNEEDYYRVNRDMAVLLATKAKEDGVSQFIFVSTIKVNGEGEDGVITENSDYNPSNAYARSKMEAEIELRRIESHSFRIAILRPPLIYGPGLKGNLFKLMRMCDRFAFIPLGGIDNKRSLVCGNNVSELVNLIIQGKNRGIFLPTDEKLYSTTYIVNSFCQHVGKSPIVFSLGPIRQLIKILKKPLYGRLFGDFVVDSSATRHKLNWKPSHDLRTFLNSQKDCNDF